MTLESIIHQINRLLLLRKNRLKEISLKKKLYLPTVVSGNLVK
jgi:hypothetical protein